MDWIGWLTPWEFSPALVLMFLVGGGLYIRGARVHRVSMTRQFFFWLGLILLYASLHTRLDYYAERMFFIHRIQHLVLHHLGPLLVIGAYPGQVMRAGLPMSWRFKLRDFRHTRTGRTLEAVLTHKILVPLCFVFFVVIWMVPTIQFYSMLDWRLYRFMNWSVVISGFLYWNLILDRRPSPPAAMSPGGRIFSPVLTMSPQMLVGAIVTFTGRDLYPIFDLCGRAIPGITAQTDQTVGGLIMWVPAGFIEIFGLLFALATLMRLSAKGRLPDKRAAARAKQAAITAATA